jgi:hypothetical protein
MMPEITEIPILSFAYMINRTLMPKIQFFCDLEPQTENPSCSAIEKFDLGSALAAGAP